MSAPSPAYLDTLAFSGLSERDLRERALATRPGLDLYEHPLSFVRRRVAGLTGADAPTLAILPDGPATIESYDGLIEALGARFRIVLLELPGFGFSFPKDPAAVGFDETADILAEALADLDCPNTVLVGPCVQGLVAARMAERTPDRVQGLLIAQTADLPGAMTWAGEVLDPKGHLKVPYAGQIGFRLARERATIDWWAPFAAGPHFPLAEFQDEARRVQRAGCCYALASQIQAWSALDPEPALAPSCPATVIWGLADKSHAATDRRSILRYVPKARFEEWEDTGHFPDLERPERLAREALALLEG